MAKLMIVSLLATLMVASTVQGGLHDLKHKLFHRYGGSFAGASASTYGNGNFYSGASASAAANSYRGGSSAAAAASVQSQNYAPAPVVRAPPAPAPAPVEPQKPAFDINAFKSQNNLGFRPYNAGANVASAASAAAGAGNSASAAAAASGSYQQGGYYAPGSFAAASGTFAQTNDNNGFEQRHFSNEVDNMENHEMGRADDDHYYNAKSYGKAADEQEHVNYNKNFEDIMSSPTVYHSVKSNESLLKDHNKSSRETGSAVEAKDHHSAGYQKHQKHFHQKADSGSVQGGAAGAGSYATENDSLNHNMEDDDEMYFDSDGLQGNAAPVSAVGMATNFGQSAGAASAVRGAFGGSAASSASLGMNNGRFGRFGGSAAAAASVN